MSQEFKKLYKPGAKGEIRVWSVSVEGPVVTILHGVEGGKMVEKLTTVQGKNIGKKNETTAEEQALKVAESKWKHQKDRKGYGLTVEAATVARMPQLAYDFNKMSHRISYPAGVQVKLDGIRCLATKSAEGVVSLTSRTGRPFPADLSHLKEALDAMLMVDTILDGEIFLEGVDLEDISGAVQATNDLTPKLEYYVFDIADGTSDNGRRASVLQNFFVPRAPIRLVKTHTVMSEREVRVYHDACVREGGEGVIIRNRDAMYTWGRRNPGLQKLKTFIDKEFPVVDIQPDTDGNPVFTCLCGDSTFTTTIDGDREGNLKYLQNRKEWLGRWLNVQFFKYYKKTGLPQHPKGKYFRAVDEAGNPEM